MIAAQHQGDQSAIAGCYDQCFHTLADRHAEEVAHVFYGVLAWGVYALHCSARRIAFSERWAGFGGFDVGRVVAAITVGDVILAGFGNHVKFVIGTATYIACIGAYGAKSQTRTGKNPRVGVMHFLISVFQRGGI